MLWTAFFCQYFLIYVRWKIERLVDKNEIKVTINKITYIDHPAAFYCLLNEKPNELLKEWLVGDFKVNPYKLMDKTLEEIYNKFKELL